MNTFDNDDDDLNYEYEYPEKFKELNFEEPSRMTEIAPWEEEEYLDEVLELDEGDYVEWDDDETFVPEGSDDECIE